MILVTGAAGNIGRAVVSTLRSSGEPVVALARDARKARNVLAADLSVRVADYADRPALRAAFQGVKRLVMIPSDGEATAVLHHHANLINAAKEAEVSHTLFISISDLDDGSPFYFTPVYRDAEKRLRDVALPHVLIRCNLYAEFLAEHYLKPAFLTGKLDAPLGDSAMAPVARKDVAEVAAALALRPDLQGTNIPLSGPTALTGHQLAAIAAKLWAGEIRYDPMPVPDYLLKLLTEQVAPWPHAFSSMALSISQGRYAALGDGVERILGRPPTSLEDVLAGMSPR
ncbi:MAG: NAD(P)H-binding protein [Pseudomonadota bacterium]